jgi:aspartyl protease family protein
MVGWALRQLAIWIGAALVFYIAAQNLKQPSAPAPASAAGAPSPAAAPMHGAGLNSLVFHANAQGHVVLDGVVNGSPVRFMVDTGATMVGLTMRDALAAGLTHSDLHFTMRMNTANGIAFAAPVTLREVRIGQLVLNDVQAAVSEHLHVSLLGQSFLTRLDSYEMRDGVLTLTYW